MAGKPTHLRGLATAIHEISRLGVKHTDGLKCTAFLGLREWGMYTCGQIPNPNIQIPNKFKISNIQCSKQSLAPVANSFVLVIGILVIRICLGFGAWDLGFMNW
jgi:hypothetical protein